MTTQLLEKDGIKITITERIQETDFISAINVPVGESDLCQTDALTQRALALGIVPNDLPEDNQRKINRAIISKFIALGLEPIPFKKIGLGWYRTVSRYHSDLRRFVNSTIAVFNLLTKYDEFRTDLSGAGHAQPGITVNSGNTEDAWERHTIASYVAEGNGFPRKAVDVLEKLVAIRLPIGASVMIWTPDRLTRPPYAGPAPDPLLVVEFGNGLCVPLCRWND